MSRLTIFEHAAKTECIEGTRVYAPHSSISVVTIGIIHFYLFAEFQIDRLLYMDLSFSTLEGRRLFVDDSEALQVTVKLPQAILHHIPTSYVSAEFRWLQKQS